jgi:TonB family protein
MANSFRLPCTAFLMVFALIVAGQTASDQNDENRVVGAKNGAASASVGRVHDAPEPSTNDKAADVDPPEPFEALLLEALRSYRQLSDIDYEYRALRFRGKESGDRYVFVYSVEADSLAGERKNDKVKAHVAFLTRVTRQNGKVVCVRSIEEKIAAWPDQSVTWMGQCHLQPGKYDVESVVHDCHASRFSVRRQVLQVPPPTTGPDMSSVFLYNAVYSGGKAFVLGETRDNSLRIGEKILVPALPARYFENQSAANFYVTLYPQDGNPEPLGAEILLFQDGRQVGQGEIKLPSPERSGEIRHFGSLPIGSRAVGDYEIMLVARQGDAEVRESASFSIVSVAGSASQIADENKTETNAIASEDKSTPEHHIKKPRKIRNVKPRYPRALRRQGVHGEVLLECVISKEGRVENVAPLRGHPELVQAAIDAVRKWRYEPTLIDGKPIPVLTTITMSFKLN